MSFKRTMKSVSIALVMMFVLSLVGPYLPVADILSNKEISAAETSAMTQSIGNLQIGDRVVDNSWEWEHRTGPDSWDGVPYSGTGETKPVTWIVVAKNHYSGGDAGSVSGGAGHVTLVTEEIIGKYTFDNSTNRGFSFYGSNHWGDSGHPDADYGIRKFLNGSSYSGSDTNSYAHTFYDAMSLDFQSGVLTTTLPNKVWDTGTSYTTADKVFLPSTTELGNTSHAWTYPIGSDWGYFTDNASRVAQLAGNNWWYWTRSSDSHGAHTVRHVLSGGGFSHRNAYRGSDGVRPALNLSSGISVSGTPNNYGAYELIGQDDEEMQKISVSMGVERIDTNTLKMTAVSTGGNNVEYRFDMRVMGSDNGYTTIKDYSPNPVFTWTDARDGEIYELVVHADAKDAEYSAYYVVFGNTDPFAIVPFRGIGLQISADGNQINISTIPQGGSNVIYALQIREDGGEYNPLDPSNPYQSSPKFVRALPFGNYEIVVHAIDMAAGQMTYMGEWQAYTHR